MKKTILFLIATSIGLAQVPTQPQPEYHSKDQEIAALKEQVKQAGQVAQYYQVVAERNEMAVRLMQVQAELEAAKKKIAELEKKS